MASKNDNLNQLIDQISQLTLLQANELNEKLKEALGIKDSDLQPMGSFAAPAASASEPAAQEKTEFNVVLKSAGTDKMSVIKAIRALVPALSVMDAKKASEEPNYVLMQNIAKSEAEAVKKQFSDLGATIELA